MAGHKARPQVVKPTVKRRLIELGKDVLIVALSCSALLLITRTSLFGGMKWISSGEGAVQAQSVQPQATPYLMAVRNERGLYGAVYDREATTQTFERLSPLLGEALTTAGESEAIGERRWRALLEQPGFYCNFQGEPSLGSLSNWLGSGGFPQDVRAAEVLLARDGKGVWLAWRQGEDFFAALTQVEWQGRLESALEEFNPDGAAFAYALAENDPVYDRLDPYVLISPNTIRPAQGRVAWADLTGDQAAREELLDALGFHSDGALAYMASDGWLAITEGTDRLRVSRSGDVTYYAREESRYPLAKGSNRAETAAEAAWQLLERVTAQRRGDAELILSGCTATEDGWEVTFSYRLDGIPVLVGTDGWGASFTIRDGQITDFTLRLRTYTLEEMETALPSPRLAAAALDSLPGAGGRLELCYSDNGAESLLAGWVARGA